MRDGLTGEIQKDQARHQWYQEWDFRKAQALLWAGIVSSLSSSLHAAGVFELGKTAGALIAIVPAAVILIDKTFKHSARSSWHGLYALRLKSLQRAAAYRNKKEADLSQELDSLDLEMHGMFPPLDASALAQRAANGPTRE